MRLLQSLLFLPQMHGLHFFMDWLQTDDASGVCIFTTDARIIIFFIDVKWTLMIECDTFNLKIFDSYGVCIFATDARIIIFFIDVKWTLMIECDTFNCLLYVFYRSRYNIFSLCYKIATNRWLLRSLVFLPQMHGLYNVNMIYKICTDE